MMPLDPYQISTAKLLLDLLIVESFRKIEPRAIAAALRQKADELDRVTIAHAR